MSEENVELVRASTDAYNRRDFDALDGMLAYVDPGFELHTPVIGGAEGSVCRGHDGVRRWYGDTLETCSEVRGEIEELRDLGDRVLLLGRLKALGRESGVSLDSPAGFVYTFRNGLLVKTEGFLSHAEALEAAGLS